MEDSDPKAIEWNRVGDVLALAEGLFPPDYLPVGEMLRAFHQGNGTIRLSDGSSVSANKWVLTPYLVAKITDSRVTLGIEARGGSARVQSMDPNILAAGHLLKGNRWYPLESESTSHISRALGELHLALGTMTLKELLSLRGAKLDPFLFMDQVTEISPEFFGIAFDSDSQPRGITASLYPYQLTGWRWLRFLAEHEIGGLLADEMGLGKTLQVIALISDPGNNSLRPVLVVAPGTLLENWRREIAKFAPKIDVEVHQGPFRTGSPRELRSRDLIITSYDTVVRDNGLLATVEWDAVVLDEAQAIRNPGTARSAAIFSLRRRRSYAMSGTPIENRLTDLWSIMNFVAPGYLGGLKEFKQIISDDIDGATKLERLVSPLMLRRRVADVAQDLPERIDIDVPLVMPRAEAEIYEALRQKALQEYGASGPMVAITKLRQFCGHPIAADIPYPDPDAFPKIERLIEIAEEVFSSSEKMIIFTSYTKVSDLIVTTMRRRLGAWIDQIDGRVESSERQGIIDAFTSVPGAAALILNPKVAGAGLNITAATHVVHYGLEWNPALEAQASARAWRRGQDRPVTVHRLFFIDTIEEVMNERLQRKSELSDVAVVGVEGSEQDTHDVLSALSVSPLAGGTE